MKFLIILMLCGQPQYYLASDGDQFVYSSGVNDENAELFYNILTDPKSRKYRIQLHTESGFHCA